MKRKNSTSSAAAGSAADTVVQTVVNADLRIQMEQPVGVPTDAFRIKKEINR